MLHRVAVRAVCRPQRWLRETVLTALFGIAGVAMSIVVTAFWAAVTAGVSTSWSGWIVTGLWGVTFLPTFVFSVWAAVTGRWKSLWGLGVGFAIIPLWLLVLAGSWKSQIAVVLLGSRSGTGSLVYLPVLGIVVASAVLRLALLVVGSWHYAHRPEQRAASNPWSSRQ